MRTLEDLKRMTLGREIYEVEKQIRDAVANRQNTVIIKDFYNSHNKDEILNELLDAEYDYSRSNDEDGFPNGNDLIIKCK